MGKSFKQEMASGVAYTAIAKYSSILVSLLVTMVLSRILDPSDFGVVAVATIFINFFAILSDLGLGAAIVQSRQLSPVDLSNLFSFSVYLSIFLSLLFFAFSWSISLYYKNDSLVPICQLLSLNILFSTLNLVPNALMMRDKHFKFIAIRTLAVQVAVGIISVFAVLHGAGVYALLVNPIVGSAIIFGVTYRSYPLPFRFCISKSSLRKVASYSFYQFAFSFINYFTRNLDKLLIGKVIGLHSLGYYEKSYRLMMLPLQNISYVVTPVMHPILADYQNDITIQREKYISLVRWLALIGFPLSVFLFFSAKELIILFFGDQWLPSVPIFQILSLTVWCQIIGSTTGIVFQATNQTKKMFYVGLVNTLVNVSGLLIGIFIYGTVEAVTWMIVITFYVGSWNYWYMARYIFHCSVVIFIRAILPALYTMMVMVVLMGSLSYSMSDVSLCLLLLSKTLLYCTILLCSLHFAKFVDIPKFIVSGWAKLKELYF